MFGKVGLGNPILIGTGSAVVKGCKVRDNHLHDMKGGTGHQLGESTLTSQKVESVRSAYRTGHQKWFKI